MKPYDSSLERYRRYLGIQIVHDRLNEAAELLADEVDLLFEDPMPAFLDDTAIGRIGDHLCRKQ